jgi:TFIIF-interacting CTD phosphatase-like protein
MHKSEQLTKFIFRISTDYYDNMLQN